MIDRHFDKYTGECDACGAKTEDFESLEECWEWIKDNWCIKSYYRNNERLHFCNECREQYE